MRILVVDDSKTMRFLIIKILKELGYTDIDEAENVDNALICMKQVMPDLILSDMMMPGKSGVDFLKIIKSKPVSADIPFIMITAVNEKKLIMNAIKAGLLYYMIKPIEKGPLTQKLQLISETYHIQPPVTGSNIKSTASNIEDKHVNDNDIKPEPSEEKNA